MSAFIVIAIAFTLVVYSVLVMGGRCSDEEEKRRNYDDEV